MRDERLYQYGAYDGRLAAALNAEFARWLEALMADDLPVDPVTPATRWRDLVDAWTATAYNDVCYAIAAQRKPELATLAQAVHDSGQYMTHKWIIRAFETEKQLARICVRGLCLAARASMQKKKVRRAA